MLITDEAPDLDSIVRLYGYDLGLTEYPIWNDERREWLNNRIIDHFRFRKISAESSVQFIYFLNRTMTEYMPTINPIFIELEKAAENESWLDYLTTDTSTSTTSSTSDGSSLYSDTPQTQLYTDEGENYATNLTEQKSSGTNDNTSSSTHSGRSTMVSTALQEWLSGVNNALNILFYYLEPCFLQIY